MDSGGHAALIFADLDQFKSINSTLGHAAGDDLLRAIANRFSTCVGDHGMAARLGGDEFAFVIEGLGKEYEQALLSATEWCQRLLALSQRGFGLHGHDFRTSASLGALVFGAGEHTSDELIARADLAMHQAKSESRDTYRFYDAKLGREVIRKASLLNDLRLALPRNELLLMYPAPGERDGLRGWRGGARALATSDSRSGFSGGLHSAGGAKRICHRDRPMGPEGGLRRARAMASSEGDGTADAGRQYQRNRVSLAGLCEGRDQGHRGRRSQSTLPEARIDGKYPGIGSGGTFLQAFRAQATGRRDFSR